MKSDKIDALELRSQLSKTLLRFARQDDGIVTVFACFMIMMMILVGGIGVDLMRNEMERVKIQNTLDRAVLAAADLDQTQTVNAVITDYMEKAGLGQYLGTITPNVGSNYRIACANTDARYTPTQFMRLVGVDQLPLSAYSCAEERIAKVEISLVLDVSGSMKNNDKLQNMQDAAGVFIDTVIREETEDLVSLTLVPYSQHVNAGPLIFDQLDTVHMHNFSHCIEMDDTAYDTTRLDRAVTYTQMQHTMFNRWSNTDPDEQNPVDDTICPRFSYERIVPFSQDADYLKAQVNQYRPRAGTQIFMGMKWAAAMLDPDFQTITSALAGQGDVDPIFASRPAAFTDEDTIKTVILMTDGKNSGSRRIQHRYYNSDSEYVHWNENNYQKYTGENSGISYWSWSEEKYDADQGDDLLENVCDAAKEEGIVIWSIGFEVDDHGADVMLNCASSPSHFFRVEGIDLTDAFRAIARQINQLKLTQ